MLAFSSDPFNSEEWIFEIKYDGTRAITYIDKENKSVRMLNRRLIWFESRYPEFKDLWKNVQASRVILDGEVVVFDNGKPNFYKLEEREHVADKFRIELLSKLMPATYVIFDILYLDGKNLTELELMKRKEILNSVIKESNHLLIADWIEENGKEFFEAVKSKGLEGIMAKKKNSRYEIGKRSKNWLKIKVNETQDAIVVGYTTGKGRREEFGSLILAAYDNGELRYIGKVGTGFSEKTISQLKTILKKLETEKCPLPKEPKIDLPSGRKIVWVKPKIVCEVKFMSWTEEKQMRAPVFVRIRNDKPMEECVLS